MQIFSTFTAPVQMAGFSAILEKNEPKINHFKTFFTIVTNNLSKSSENLVTSVCAPFYNWGCVQLTSHI